jgi:hypothetical protein
MSSSMLLLFLVMDRSRYGTVLFSPSDILNSRCSSVWLLKLRIWSVFILSWSQMISRLST